jgi:ATP-dependent helicase/nuclease subunit A
MSEDETSEDFSIKLKNYTNNKCEDNENNISGDSIIDNDTFFGLMLPSIAHHINGQEPQFFNLMEIPLYTEDYIEAGESKFSVMSGKMKYPNNQQGLNAYIESIESFYRNAEIIKTPVLFDNHITPTALSYKDDNMGFPVNQNFSGKKSDDIFFKVDSILSRFSDTSDKYGEKFNWGSFGTIAHICVEALLNSVEPEIPPKIAGFLSPTEMNIFLTAGKELALRFIDSPLGQTALNAKMLKNEFSFRSLIKNKSGKEMFINGIVDLFFDDGEYIHIVDFKTDSNETPGEYITQMACYYNAINSLYAIPDEKDCRVLLYYLRTGHAVEITQNVKQIDLEKVVFS